MPFEPFECDDMVYCNVQPNFPITAGEAIAATYLVAISPVDGLGYLACGAVATPELGALGVSETSVPEGGRASVKHEGQVEGASGLWPGDLVYVASTPGLITTTVAGGDISQQVGFAISTTKWVICIEQIASQTTESSSSSSSSSESSSSSSSSSTSTSSSSSSSSSTGA